jgi:hypothetical protein
MSTVDPTPPNNFGLTFISADFLANLVKVEKHLAGVYDPTLHTLMEQIKALQFGQVSFAAFVASGLPEGEEASPLLAALLLEVDSMQVIDCYMAAIAVTEVIIAQINGNKKHEDIVAFVDSLLTVDLATIPREDMRCPHCWADFDGKVEGYSNEPKRVPWCGKRFDKDCLIKAIKGACLICPLCRQNWPLPASAPQDI